MPPPRCNISPLFTFQQCKILLRIVKPPTPSHHKNDHASNKNTRYYVGVFVCVQMFLLMLPIPTALAAATRTFDSTSCSRPPLPATQHQHQHQQQSTPSSALRALANHSLTVQLLSFRVLLVVTECNPLLQRPAATLPFKRRNFVLVSAAVLHTTCTSTHVTLTSRATFASQNKQHCMLRPHFLI